MLRLICSILLILPVLSSSAQGSWNIGYISIDTLNKRHIGRTVRIDFKTPKIKKEPAAKRHIRSYVGTRDTGVIELDAALMSVTEKRRIYPDHGNYDDQFLECLDCKGSSFRIYDAEILEVDEQSILFRIVTVLVGKKDKHSKLIWIERDKLDGVLYKL